MPDSLRWLIPEDLKLPTYTHILIAIGILIVSWIVQRYVIKKINKRIAQFLEDQSHLFYARILEQFSRSIRYAFMTTALFISLAILFEVWLFGNLTAKDIYYSLLLYFAFKGVYDVLTYYTNNPFSFHASVKEQDLLTPFFLRMAKVIVMLIALFSIASLWNFNLNGFLTGIGLTGVALAFGVRDTLAHIFGGLSVALDKPFQIGDWIITEDGKIDGCIEDINLRSTLIQTGDKGLVYVPNSYLVNRPIYNVSKRTKRKCEYYLYVSSSNEEAVLRTLCEQINEQIHLHPEIENDIIHVYIDDFRPGTYRILLRYFVKTNDTGEMLQVKQDIIFATKQIFEETRIELVDFNPELWAHQ